MHLRKGVLRKKPVYDVLNQKKLHRNFLEPTHCAPVHVLRPEVRSFANSVRAPPNPLKLTALVLQQPITRSILVGHKRMGLPNHSDMKHLLFSMLAPPMPSYTCCCPWFCSVALKSACFFHLGMISMFQLALIA